MSQQSFLPTKAEKCIKIPKEMMKLDDMRKRGIQIPQEIQIIEILLNECHTSEEIYEMVTLTSNHYHHHYHKNQRPKQKRNRYIFKCNICEKVFTICFDENETAYIMSEIFDLEIHDKEVPFTLKSNENEIECIKLKTSLLPKQKEMKLQLSNTQNQSQLIYPQYSLIRYLQVLSMMNKDIDYRYGTGWISDCITGNLFELIDIVSIILPSSKYLEFIPNIVSLDATFHDDNKNITVTLTGIDQLKHIVLLGFAIGIKENKDVVSYLLLHFKDYLISIGKSNEFIENIKIISDRGSAIKASVDSIFYNNIHYYCLFHIAGNILSHLKKKSEPTFIINYVSKTRKSILNCLSRLCTTGKLSVLIHEFENIVFILFNMKFNNIKNKNELLKYNTVEKETIHVNRKLFDEKIDYYNNLVDELLNYIFNYTEPQSYISLFMIHDQMKFNRLSSQISESYNHKISFNKRQETTEQIHSILNAESIQINKRKQIHEFSDFYQSEKFMEIINLEKLQKSKCEIKKIIIDSQTTEYEILDRKRNIEIVREHINQLNGKKEYCCTCGIPQNLNIECSHVLFVTKDWKDKNNYSFTKIQILSEENYKEFYKQQSLIIPPLGKEFITTSEYVSTNQSKRSENDTNILNVSRLSHSDKKGKIEIEIPEKISEKIPEPQNQINIKEVEMKVEKYNNLEKWKSPFIFDPKEVYETLKKEMKININDIKIESPKQQINESERKEIENKSHDSGSKKSDKSVSKIKREETKESKKESKKEMKTIVSRKEVPEMKEIKEKRKKESKYYSSFGKTNCNIIETIKYDTFPVNDIYQKIEKGFEKILVSYNPEINEITLNENLMKKYVERYWIKLEIGKKRRFKSWFKSGDYVSNLNNYIHPWLFEFIFQIYENMMISDKNILFISSAVKRINDIKKYANKSEARYICYPQFSGNDAAGHWRLNIYDKMSKIVYILDSLHCYLNKSSYTLYQAFEESECCVIKGIPQQEGVTCGYNVLFFLLIVSCFSKSIDGLIELINKSYHYFKAYCKFIHQFYIKFLEYTYNGKWSPK